MSVRSQSEVEAELLHLIESFSAAYQLEDLPRAARYIDRAWRLSPENPEINHLYGQLHLTAGAFTEAVRFLKMAMLARPNADFAAAYLLAIYRGGQSDSALDELHECLRQFVCEPGSALAEAAAEICLSASTGRIGWVGIAADLTIHGAVQSSGDLVRLELISTQAGSRCESILRDPLQRMTPFRAGYAAALPDGRVIVRADGAPLVGGDLAIPLDFGLDGRATINTGAVEGWVTLTWDPERSPELILQGEDGHRLRVTSTPDSLQPGRHLFIAESSICRRLGNQIAIFAVLPDGRLDALPDTPLIVEVPPPFLPIHRVTHEPVTRASSNIVDIIIPVYAGFDETLACIQSVLETVGSCAHIIVIDDDSPDPELTDQLDMLSESQKITLIRNSNSLGFPASINRGLKLHPDRDIVVLTANIEPFGNWLERLRTAAYSAQNIATVGPLQGSRDWKRSKRPVGQVNTREYAVERDRVAAALNAGKTISAANADSSCLYIRRDGLDALGLFDSLTFAGGYGEDVDFGLRAAISGWENVLATDIYVHYLGERRPEALRAALVDRNARLVELRYRDVSHANNERTSVDPELLVRRQLDEACLAAANRRQVLYVSLALGGGVERAVRDRAAVARSRGFRTIVLRPDLVQSRTCWLEIDEPGFADLRYDIPADIPELIGFLRRLKFDHVELHHFLDLPPDLIDGVLALDCAVDVRIHDYIWYCPRVNLLNGLHRYCGEPEVAVCEGCIKQNGSYLDADISVAALRERSRRWLERANSITVPTAGVAVRYQTRFPGLRFSVEALEKDLKAASIPTVSPSRIKVAVIGALGDHKGLSILIEMAQLTAGLDLPLEFVVFGFTKNDAALLATNRVFITGEYEESEIDGLIARENPDLALFLSQFPETWCYALTHALRAMVPVAALNIGAIGERLSASSSGPLLFPVTSSAAEICEEILLAFGVVAPMHGPGFLRQEPSAGGPSAYGED